MSELSLKEEESPLINTPSADNFYGDDNDQGDNDDEDINAEEEEENSEEHESEEHEPEEMQEYLDTIDLNQQEEEDEPYVFSIFDILDKPRILPDPVDLTFEHLKKIEEELGLIKLCWPKIESLEFPKAYLENVQKEKVLLAYTENFRRQFFLQFPNRKPLFLAAVNECGMQLANLELEIRRSPSSNMLMQLRSICSSGQQISCGGRNLAAQGGGDATVRTVDN
ncbi:unnamed protein product [Brassicogethes aeneus]|uniref:Uncharacterized protein n=1 Tax=Brassicogethes aeneus TaxID=1431903 RepID=A0A9P0FDU9_BRAAE|nr:unnamed protein product [Brassicogethes aeneus]